MDRALRRAMLNIAPKAFGAILASSGRALDPPAGTRTDGSIVAVNDIANCFQDFLFYFGERSANPRARRKFVSTTAELLANGRDVDAIILGTHADAHFSLGQFFKKDRDDDSLDRAQVIDQAFIVFGFGAEFGGDFQAETKAGDLAVPLEAHRAEKFPE